MSVDDPHHECVEIEGGEVDCAVHARVLQLCSVARHFDEEAERCARRGYPLNAWSAALDARSAWGAAAVYALIWLLDECPVAERLRSDRKRWG